MPPRLSEGWPHSAASQGVVVIEPAIHGAYVERRRDRVELELGPRHPRAVPDGRTRYGGSQELGALRVTQGQKPAADGVHQAVAGRVVGLVALYGVVGDVVCYVYQDLVRVGPDVGATAHATSPPAARSPWVRGRRTRPRGGRACCPLAAR